MAECWTKSPPNNFVCHDAPILVRKAFSFQGRQMVYCKPFQIHTMVPFNMSTLISKGCMMIFPHSPPLPCSLSSMPYGYIMLINCHIAIQVARICNILGQTRVMGQLLKNGCIVSKTHYSIFAYLWQVCCDNS